MVEMNNTCAFYHVASSALITLLRHTSFEPQFLLPVKKDEI